jgi:hypothetical protein
MPTKSFLDLLVAGAGWLVSVLSCEWLVTKTKHPNGGEIVFLRALLIAVFMYLFTIAAKHGLDPMRSTSLDLHEFRSELAAGLPVFGAIFAAVYFALYTRFASQWLYLSNLYNKIIETEARVAANEAAKIYIAGWKADFLEDAADLHLATKRVFAPIVVKWAGDCDVKTSFISHPSHTERMFDALVRDATAASGKQRERNSG